MSGSDLILPLAEVPTNSQLAPIFWGAGLGASFYVLTRAYEFLSNRTFDPEYSNTYFFRLVLGFISGVILAFVSQGMFDKQLYLAKFGPGVIALLGGFSAEAVEQILNRLVEIMLAAIRGDNSPAAKAKAEAGVQKARIDVTQKLASLQAQTTDNDTKNSIQQIISTLR